MRFLPGLLGLSLLGLSSLGMVVVGSTDVQAQTIIASINGDPITNIDVDERMKMLRVLRKPATREAAMESLYTDRLETHEAARYGVKPKDADIGQEIVRVAQEMKVQPEALIAALQNAGVSPDHFKAHFGADLAFGALVGALNKGVEASETEVRKELARQGGKAAAGTEYTLRQVIFSLPNNVAPAAINARGQEAEQLRQRFADCESGEKMVFALNDVTIRDPIRRTSTEISEGLRNLLDKTPVGHLTPPQRSSAGLEMIAVCRKGAALDDTALRQQISQKILATRLSADRAKRLKEMRDHAVIVHP
ncbi:conserved hypothetical protein [Beijerinckia indica subsp. indica ATCC 9039]|uniref:SurA domain n=2 Tax=Beijerinckia TaxID=532 RepID=B2IFU2_BEII9|nr:conserved hypothetical protein [Beijerinckia indica subsp. indica ATCC 9039]